jgi:hypothetical protein
MTRIQTSCPRCRQPISADVEQLFDLNQDSQAKQRFLGGSFNVAHCPACGYEGSLASPLVYHDPEKELLLTYFPPELGMPVNDQERMIGPLINQVVNHLPPEKRKAYLFQPRTMLTMQTMIDTILQADGITKEMLDAQQKRVAMLQRLLSTPSEETRAEIIKQDEELVDASMFAMLNALIENALAQHDERAARVIAAIQKELVEQTKFGQEILAQSQESDAAVKALQEASKDGLTREKLLDLMIEAPTEIRLSAYASLARNGLDYQFFQILSERIEAAEGEQKQNLVDLRTKLLQITQEIDEAVQKRYQEAHQLLEEILTAPDIEKATQEHLEQFDDFIAQAIRTEVENARKANDLERLDKLQKMIAVIEAASAPPPQVELIQELLQAPDEAARVKIMDGHREMINQEFLQLMDGLINETQTNNQSPELVNALQIVYRSALRYSMQSKLN